VKDVFFSALLVCANVALLELAEAVGADDGLPAVREWVAAGRRGVAGCWDDELELCVDYDVRAGHPLRLRTFAGFAPLLAGCLDAERQARVLAQLSSDNFTGHPRLRWAVLPSTSPQEPSFQPRTYWRGPTWPIVDWLIWSALRAGGHHHRAESLRRQVLAQVRQSPLPEYFEPFTGEPLGSARQSWTAAVTLDWLGFASQAGGSPTTL
jgi:glycogen debranching enzyme